MTTKIERRRRAILEVVPEYPDTIPFPVLKQHVYTQVPGEDPRGRELRTVLERLEAEGLIAREPGSGKGLWKPKT